MCLVTVEVVHPRVPVGALPLAGRPLADLPLVLQLALVFPASAPGRPVLEVASQNGGILQERKWHRIPGPLDQFLAGHKVNVGQGEDGVKEIEKSFLAMLPVEEPGGVEKEGEWSLGFGVVLKEVLSENLLD